MNRRTWKPYAMHQRRFLEVCFHNWVRAVNSKLRSEVVKLNVRLAPFTQSLWSKNKEELVQMAQHQLGWTEQQAKKETVAQLRLHLRELQGLIRNKEPDLLPKNLNRMLKADLVHEMTARKMDTTGMTRDQMIRDLKLWAEQVAQLTGAEREVALRELRQGPKNNTVNMETGNPKTNFPDIIKSRMPPTAKSPPTTTAPSTPLTSTTKKGPSSDCGMEASDSLWVDAAAPGKQSASLSTLPTHREAIDFCKESLLENDILPEELYQNLEMNGLVSSLGGETVRLLINTAVLELMQAPRA